MTLLWSPAFSLGAKYKFNRSYYKGFVVGWLPGVTVVSSGNPFVLQEHTYGGYKLVIEFKSNVWSWSSNRYTHDYLLENYYALFPGDTTPISAGGVTVGQSWDVDHIAYRYSLLQDGWTNLYWFDFPAAPPGYWAPPFLS